MFKPILDPVESGFDFIQAGFDAPEAILQRLEASGYTLELGVDVVAQTFDPLVDLVGLIDDGSHDGAADADDQHH
jgi:hypothetical protein